MVINRYFCSICAEGSSTMADLSSLIICLILDIVILGVVLFFKKVYNKRMFTNHYENDSFLTYHFRRKYQTCSNERNGTL